MSDKQELLFAAQLRDIFIRLEKLQHDMNQIAKIKLPDRFVPLQEATRYMHCGRDWLLAQIKAGVLRSGIDFLDRSSNSSTRRRYLVNPISAQRWINGTDPVPVKKRI